MERAELGVEDLGRAFDLAAGLQSDHNTSRVVMAAAERFGLRDDSARSAFLKSSFSLSSESTRTRVLTAFLLRALPTHEQAAAIIDSTRTIQSDYQKGRILTAVAANQHPDGDLLAAYLTSAQMIGADALVRKRPPGRRVNSRMQLLIVRTLEVAEQVNSHRNGR
jgi:hypothetical protein